MAAWYRGLRPWKRHSLVLLVAGLVYVFIGISYLRTELSPAQADSLQVALHWAPIEFWGLAFIVAGLMAIASSRWPHASVTWGYTVLTGLSSGWASFFLVGYLFGTAPSSSVRGSLTWWLIAFLWWGISGLVNPNIEPVRKEPRYDRYDDR